jgi:hypothetical protein
MLSEFQLWVLGTAVIVALVAFCVTTCPSEFRAAKEKGAGLCGCGALQPVRWCVGASRLFESYRLPREEHQHHTPTHPGVTAQGSQ